MADVTAMRRATAVITASASYRIVSAVLAHPEPPLGLGGVAEFGLDSAPNPGPVGAVVCGGRSPYLPQELGWEANGAVAVGRRRPGPRGSWFSARA